MKILLIILLAITASCNKYCDPANITDGKSERHHDQKKFRAMMRIKYTKQIGPYCVVHVENMKLEATTVCECDCSNFTTGKWIEVN